MAVLYIKRTLQTTRFIRGALRKEKMMSWIPVFKIGLWNAWILMLYFPLHPLIMIVIDKAFGTGNIFKKGGEVPQEKSEKRDYFLILAITLVLIIYSVFLPLKIGTAWIYTGLTIYLIGLVIFIIAIANIASTPEGQLFTKGLYKYSRHPGYLSYMTMNVGVGIASASWIFLLLSAIIIVLLNSGAIAEERACIDIFGDEYQAYMDKTPRWVGIPKSK